MKNLTVIKNLSSLLLLCGLVVGCVIEPIRAERTEIIKNAPDWVNSGSQIIVINGARLFRGVALATPQGDLALQKSIADDKSIVEVEKVLTSYLDVVSNSYQEASRSNGLSYRDEKVYRAIENSAEKQVNTNVGSQIDEAILRQFKEDVPRQVKDDIARQVKESSVRQIKNSIAYQVDFTEQLEEAISRQINAAVTHQIKKATPKSLSGAKIIASWRDPITNVIWSMSELYLNHVKTSMADLKELNLEMKNYIESNADNIYDRMIAEENNKSSYSFFR